MEAMIQRVDEERYDSGRPAQNFRVNRKEHPEMRFYDFKCNWGVNKCDERYYHV